jgi:peptidyl-prolyl cis-trans isomerase C
VKRILRPIIFFSLVLAVFILSACATGGQSGESAATEALTPAPTEAPMAARVNGEGILLSDYEQELQRYQAGAADLQIEVSAQDAREAVLDYLIEQTLFKQAAQENGYTVSDAELVQKIIELAEARGGQASLDTYLSENFYSQDSFRAAVARELAVIWMRNYLIDQAPATAEQVRARQILVNSQNEAIAVQRRLEVGTPFSDLAYEYDPLTGGELGWFPRGYLFQPAVEEAAFALQPGQYSGTIETNYGFHIVEVIERDPQRELKGDALIAAQRAYIGTWLADQRAQSMIEIYVN